MKYLPVILICILFSLCLKSQNKQMEGDTTSYYYRYNQSLLSDLKMGDLLKSNNDFVFRIQYYGQVIEIVKNGKQFSGTLVNYIFRTKGWNKNGTITEKTSLSDSLSKKVYRLINDSGILTLESDKQIKGWEQGADGITYVVEYASKDTYGFKSYWTPDAQGRLKEAVIVNKFVGDLSGILLLRQSYQDFKEKLPKNGCYSNGGMTSTCYISNNCWIGYTGSAGLPLGYSIWSYLGYLGNLKTGIGVSVNHQMDAHGNYDLTAQIGKANLILKEAKSRNDFATYIYRTRKQSDIKQGITYHKHNIAYGVNLKSTTVALGIDFLKGEQPKTGVSFLLKQHIRKPGFTIGSEAFIYRNQFDYKVELSRTFVLKSTFIDAISAGVYYENFYSYESIGWTISVPIHYIRH